MFVEGKTPMAEKDVPGKITQGRLHGKGIDSNNK